MSLKQKRRMAKIHIEIRPLLTASSRQERDNTGCRLVALRERADLNALVTSRSLLYSHSVDVQIFSLGFLFLLYWQWPIVTAVTLFIEKNLIRIPTQSDRKSYMAQVEAVKERIIEMYGPVAVANGKIMVPREAKRYWAKEGHFLHSFSNPSERRTAEQTWTVLGQDVISGAWENAAHGLSAYL